MKMKLIIYVLKCFIHIINWICEDYYKSNNMHNHVVIEKLYIVLLCRSLDYTFYFQLNWCKVLNGENQMSTILDATYTECVVFLLVYDLKAC